MGEDVRSIGDILRERAGQSFLGREELIKTFSACLREDPSLPDHKFVISVTGQGGAGKSTLLREFEQMARALKRRTGCADHAQATAPEVLREWAAGLGRDAFKTYNERDRKLQELLHQIDGDPDLPTGLAAAIGRSAGIVGVRLARHAPALGIAAELLDEQQVGDQAAELTALLMRKFGNRDDVALLEDPVRVLTPLFLEGLQRLGGTGAVLMLDEHETRSRHFDEWLIALLRGEYGPAPLTTLLVIAGRDALDLEAWHTVEPLLLPMHVDVFTELEVRELLRARGLEDGEIVDGILRLSGRLPVLVTMLAASAPQTSAELIDPASTAVGVFLKWTSEASRRELAVAAAIPRRLNRDLLMSLEESAAEDAFEWLIALPFVFRDRDGWKFHGLVRHLMLRHTYVESPERWRRLNLAAAKNYQQLLEALPRADGSASRIRRQYQSDRLYHTVAADRGSTSLAALQAYVDAYRNADQTLSADIARTANEAESDSGQDATLCVGEALVAVDEAQSTQRFESAADRVTAILALTAVRSDSQLQHRLLWLRSDLHARAANYRDALSDIDEAIALAGASSELRAHRGRLLREVGKHTEALAEFDRALDEPDSVGKAAIALRVQKAITVAGAGDLKEGLTLLQGVVETSPRHSFAVFTYGRLLVADRQFEEGREFLRRATELRPANTHVAQKHIAKSYAAENRLELAEEALLASLEASPVCSECWGELGELYRRRLGEEHVVGALMSTIVPGQNVDAPDLRAVRAFAIERLGFHREAESEYCIVLEADPDHVWARARRGFIRAMDLNDFESALEDFNGALAREPRMVRALRGRGICLRYLGRRSEALRDLDEVIRLAPDWLVARLDRGSLLFELEESQRALEDLEACAESQELRQASAIERGLLYSYRGDYDNALAAYSEADSEDVAVLYNIAVATTRRDGREAANEQWDRTLIQLSGDRPASREAEFYVRAGFAAIDGRAEDALLLLKQAMGAGPHARRWARRDIAWNDLRTCDEFATLVGDTNSSLRPH